MFDGLFMFFIIITFSEMHRSHVLFPGWYVEQCFTILHFIFGSTMFPCSSWFSLFVQINFDRVVEFILVSSLKECIWACMRVFTSLHVRPMYSAFWISARYRTALVLHPPSGRGQFVLGNCRGAQRLEFVVFGALFCCGCLLSVSLRGRYWSWF